MQPEEEYIRNKSEKWSRNRKKKNFKSTTMKYLFLKKHVRETKFLIENDEFS